MASSPQIVARPTGDRVLIKVMDPQTGTIHPQTSVLGIFGLQAQTNAEPDETPPDLKPARGIVVSAGPGYVVAGPDSRHYVPLDVKVGDDVLFFEERGMKLAIEGEELLLLHEQYVLVVLDSMTGRPAEAEGVED